MRKIFERRTIQTTRDTKNITKLSNKILVTSEILQKSLPNVWPGGFRESQGGGFPPGLLSVAVHMASAFGH